MVHLPLLPIEHPAVMHILNRLLPGKKVCGFSIHFPMDGIATVKADILLNEEDVKTIKDVSELFSWELHSAEAINNDIKKTDTKATEEN